MVKLLILLFLVILIISVYAANTLTKTVLDRNYELQQDSSTLSKDPEEAERAVQILCGSKECAWLCESADKVLQQRRL